jgi:hypothetical protein
MLSFNFPNFITVGIMALVVFAILGLLAQTFHWSVGKMNSASGPAQPGTY